MNIKTYTLGIVAIRKETEDTVTLCFRQPVLKKIKYLAGQYLTLIFRINGRRYIRPYSFSSAPSVDPFLEVTVKRVSGGIVSNYINDHLKEGDVIEVMSPLGDFVYPENRLCSEVFLWGVGSGITPLMSLSKSVLFEEKEVRVNLIYGNKSERHTVFGEKIRELEQKYDDRLKVWHFHTSVSEAHIKDRVIRGRIDVDKIFSTMERENIRNGLHFICGPTEFKENLVKKLGLLDVFNENIFIENFEMTKNPKDYENLEDRNIILQFEGESTSLSVEKGKSILEAALDIGLELPYSCQTGSCSTCKGKLKTGVIKMIGLTRERNDLGKDEYLLCCSYPLNNEVFIVV